MWNHRGALWLFSTANVIQSLFHLPPAKTCNLTTAWEKRTSCAPPRLLCSLSFAISPTQTLSETSIRQIRSDKLKFPRILTSLMWVLSRTGFEFFLLLLFIFKGFWQPYWSWTLRFSVSVKVLHEKHIGVMCLVPRTLMPPFASTISNAIIQISWNQSCNESHHMIVIFEGNE